MRLPDFRRFSGTVKLMKATVHMPRIGAGLAKGNWSVIEAIVAEELADTDVTVYTL